VNASIALIQASLGSFDLLEPHVPQTLPHDYFLYTDHNFPLREKTMTPRLQAKIPKMFAWQLNPGYPFYLWLDGNLSLSQPDSLQYFNDHCQHSDIVVLRHPRRPNIRQEERYIRKGLREQSIYLVNRYDKEWLKQQTAAINSDKEYVDDLLVNGGVFIYRNTPVVQELFKEWWYHVTRYIVQDQLAFPYVLKKSGARVTILDDDINNHPYLTLRKHRRR
jgi:hypothetical protein